LTTKSVTMLAAAALAMHVSPVARAESLDAVLARMDKAAKEFKSASADLKQVEYTAVIKESTEENGVLRIKRSNRSVTAITEYTKPEPHAVLFKDKEAQVYSPKAKMDQIYDLAKFNSTVDQFVLLAFGTSGEELRRNYDVTLGGAENVGSTATSRLELIPRSKEVKRLFSKFELWIPDGQGNAIREKLTAPSGDYYLLEYADVKLNVPLPDSVFDLKMPKDVKKVHAH
jgi:outer membrane lipoprotein-sorting protein